MYRFERQFGALVASLSAVAGLWSWFYGAAPVWPWFVAALAILALAVVAPVALRPPAQVWLRLGHLLGYVNTRLLLAIAFYLIITPLALLFRLAGRDALALRHEQRQSYWRRQEKDWSPDTFKNQF